MFQFRRFTGVVLAVSTAVSTVWAAELADRKVVWAHYVPWHTPYNAPLTALTYYNYPLLPSATTQQEAFRREFETAKAQGIDGFFPDIVGYRDRPTAFLGAIKGMLEATEGMEFFIAPCLDGKNTVERQVADLRKILDACAGHPNYPHVNGRPVIATYSWGAYSVPEWLTIREELKKAGHDIYLIANLSSGYRKKSPDSLAAAAKAFDMGYSFMENGIDGRPIAENINLIGDACQGAKRDLMASTWPGYYGAWLNGRNDFYHPHRGFDQLHETFEAIQPGREKWMHFTTWNDHDETSIMPMLFTWGNAGIVKAYSEAFKGVKPMTTGPQLYFAYHREELPGTVLRIEGMSVPTAAPGPMVVSGVLRGLDGKVVVTLPRKNFSTTTFERHEWLVPTAGLAHSPILVPEFNAVMPNGKSETRCLPPVLLKSGWQQNAVTVKVPFFGLVEFANTLKLRQQGEILHAAISFQAPEPVREAVLFRNDLPIGAFTAAENGKTLLHLAADFVGGGTDYTLSVENGKFVRGRGMFREPDSQELQISADRVRAVRNQTYHQAVFWLEVTPQTRIRVDVPGTEPVLVRPAQFAERRVVRVGKLALFAPVAMPTLEGQPQLGMRDGELSLTTVSRSERADDLFYVRYVLASGAVGYSQVELPFAGNAAPVKMALLNTCENLETSSDGSGKPGQNEYLTPREQLPFLRPEISENMVHPAAIRRSRWTFERGGEDSLGDMYLRDNRYVWGGESRFIRDGGVNDGKCVAFDGKLTLRMPLRTFPQSNFSLDFFMDPAADRAADQSVVARRGWAGAVSVNLLRDGRLELVRNGNNRAPIETLVGKSVIPSGRWSRIRVLCDEKTLELYVDGKLDTAMPVAPSRSYGNSTWFLGGGFTGKANFIGRLDDVTILGVAARPGEAHFPADDVPVKLSVLETLNGSTLTFRDVATGGKWSVRNGTTVIAGKPGMIQPLTEAAKAAVVTQGNDGGVALQVGPGASRAGTDLTHEWKLGDFQELVIPLKRYEVPAKRQGWTALIVSLRNRAGERYSFNIGNPETLMLTENRPKWRILTGKIGYKQPAELAFRRLNGRIVLLLDGKVMGSYEDNPSDPYDTPDIQASQQSGADAIAAEFGPVRHRDAK